MEELGQQQNIKSTDVITPAGRRDSVSRVEPAKHTRCVAGAPPSHSLLTQLKGLSVCTVSDV